MTTATATLATQSEIEFSTWLASLSDSCLTCVREGNVPSRSFWKCIDEIFHDLEDFTSETPKPTDLYTHSVNALMEARHVFLKYVSDNQERWATEGVD